MMKTDDRSERRAVRRTETEAIALVTFRVGGDRYAFPVHAVEGVIRSFSEDGVAGDDTGAPVEAGALLGLPRTEGRGRSQGIVLRGPDAGEVVLGVEGAAVREVRPRGVDAVPARLSAAAEVVQSVIRDEEGLLLVLDPAAVYRRARSVEGGPELEGEGE
jgi:chemotaxis signal transduction protein